MTSFPAWALGLALALPATWAAAQAPDSSATVAPPRYTYSWPLEGDALKPRGGSTQGAPVTLESTPSPAWQALQAPGLAPQERDRRAILAMAGTYRVSFDFLEIDPYSPGDHRMHAPYQSWGTEKVFVDQDEPGMISLVHILEMRVVDAQGVLSEPMVIKHWRQDWTYEPRDIVEFQGRDRWRRRALSSAERRGAWRQTVYQVDESPRYASVGRWVHNASFSSWLSAETWRPLPRREWSVRQDYQALVGTNRHTINPAGWTQEENNLKTVLTAQRHVDPEHPHLAREVGMARYERLAASAGDFTGADRYQARTRRFWQRVRAAWAESFTRQGTLTLRGPVDQLGLFVPLFEHAERIVSEDLPPDDTGEAKLIRSVLADMGVAAP